MDKFLRELGKLIELYGELKIVDNVDKCVDCLILFSVRLGKLSVDRDFAIGGAREEKRLEIR